MTTLSCKPMLRTTIHRRGPMLALCVLLLSATAGAEELAVTLKQVPTRIVYETWQDNNWELFTVRADGSEMANLTKTPALHELYPHVSPDGTKICFVCDEGTGAGKIRNVYVMNLDGTDRKLVATNCAGAVLEGGLDGHRLSERRSGTVHLHRLRDQGDLLLRPDKRPAHATPQQGTHAPVQSMLVARRQVVRGDGPCGHGIQRTPFWRLRPTGRRFTI